MRQVFLRRSPAPRAAIGFCPVPAPQLCTKRKRRILTVQSSSYGGISGRAVFCDHMNTVERTTRRLVLLTALASICTITATRAEAQQIDLAAKPCAEAVGWKPNLDRIPQDRGDINLCPRGPGVAYDIPLCNADLAASGLA